MRLSQYSFGKIHEGQKVLVRFSEYPYQEFGAVSGRVSYLSAIPVSDSLFLAKVRFSHGLMTTDGKKLPPTNGMAGQAKIITKNRRLLERLYDSITSQLQ
jgi:HlyD family secretion protein